MSAPARPDDDDSALCDAVRDGDTSAFAVLFTRHHAAARRMARRAGADDVDDVVGEAFAATMRALLGGQGPGPSPFRPYLRAVIRNEADRARRRRLGADATWSENPRASRAGCDVVLDDPTSVVDDRMAILDAARGLTPRHRDVLFALVVADRPLEDVAADMDLSPNAVRVLAWRARGSLRAAYRAAADEAAAPRALSGGPVP